MTDTTDAHDTTGDHSQTRRRFLTAATSAVGVGGVAGVAVPFLGSWNPSEKAKAAGAPVRADIGGIEPGTNGGRSSGAASPFMCCAAQRSRWRIWRRSMMI